MATLQERVPAGGHLAGLAARLEMTPLAVAAVLAVTVLATGARLVALGARVMHFDEGRVAFWALRYARIGHFEYRYIVHGPLLQHADRHLFALLGAGDAVVRLPVALVGGLLPLAALLFRDRLRDAEVAALAGLLAANPILVYYSRFMRSDVLVAAFALVALGALVRLHATRRPRYLHLAAVSFALAFASKENAVVYALCWVGAAGLIVGLEVLYPRRVDSPAALARRARGRAAAAVGAFRAAPDRPLGHALAAVGLFLAVTLFLYAPRAPPGGGVGLWHSPPTEVVDATAGHLRQGFGYWAADGSGPPGCGQYHGDGQHVEKYLCNLGRELTVLGKGAAALAVLAVVGAAVEFARERPRLLAPAGLYWGVASVLGYPLGTDILFPPWLTVHVVVPLALPAAVGLAALGGWIVAEVPDGDLVAAAGTAMLLVLLVGSMVGAAAHHAYVAPAAGTSGEANVAQFAQPEAAARGGIDATIRASEATAGLDVLVYDARSHQRSSLVDMDEQALRKPACIKWFKSLPLSWYLYRSEAAVACADDADSLEAGLGGDPPVVVTRPSGADDVRSRLGDEYVSATYELRQSTREVVFFFDATRVDPPPDAPRAPARSSTAGRPGASVTVAAAPSRWPSAS